MSKQIKKKSGKPFKGGLKIARIVEKTTHYITGREAFKVICNNKESVIESRKCVFYERPKQKIGGRQSRLNPFVQAVYKYQYHHQRDQRYRI